MTYVFSDTLICEDAATAKAVTFNPGVRVRSVTLDGDVYDPSGTLSGGAPPQSSGLLVQAQQLQEANRALHEAEKKAQALLAAEANARPAREQWRLMAQQLEIKEHELRLLEEQLNGSSATQVFVFLCTTRAKIDDSPFLTGRPANRESQANDCRT
jgi:structural maintenance of chromosome 2